MCNTESKVKCLRCGYSEFEGALHIHHVDGNKKNDSSDNKIVLCANCHLTYHQNMAWTMESIGLHEPIHDAGWYRINRNPEKEKERKAEKNLKWIEKLRIDLKSGLVI